MRYNMRKRLYTLFISSAVLGVVLVIIKTQHILDDGDVRSSILTYSGSRSVAGDQQVIERFTDEKVDRLIELISNTSLFDVAPLVEYDFPAFAKSLGQKARNSANYTRARPTHTFNRTGKTNFQLFHYGIQTYSLYNPDDPAIEGLIHDMANLKITAADLLTRGSQLKLFVRFIDNGTAVMKPMRNKREYERTADQFQFEEFERHNAEIAAFHMSRVLGFYLVPPVSGRVVDMKREIRPLAKSDLNRTFYYSPAGNLCFWGKCAEHCDAKHSFCGQGDKIEVSLMAYLPKDMHMQDLRNPYRYSYNRFRPADFSMTDKFCERVVFGKKMIKDTASLLNLVDLHIFDFLQGNRDRHRLNYFDDVGAKRYFNFIDNGRGFGNTQIDEYNLLAPLWQCCKIRKSTLKKFVSLYLGPRPLSYYLDQSLKSDPLYPILVDGHLTAVNRRATRVLTAVMECVDSGHSLQDIVIDSPI